jgi:hypothetical protein
MRTLQLPVVDWTDAPADLYGLVRFAERRNLVSARVPSHTKRSLLLWDCCTDISHFSSTSVSDNEPRYNAYIKVIRRHNRIYHYALTSIWCRDWEWVGVQLYSAVSRITGTADTSQILTNSADPSPHKYLNPHIPKAQLAVTLTHGISANKELTCLHLKTLLKPVYRFITTPIICPAGMTIWLKWGKVYGTKYFYWAEFIPCYTVIRDWLYIHINPYPANVENMVSS